VYLASTSTQLDQDVWLIDSGSSYHMTPHKEWFCEYERYDGGDLLLGDEFDKKNCRTWKIMIDIAGWEENNPSRCATHSEFGNKPDICQ
jgi:hypothetical protein